MPAKPRCQRSHAVIADRMADYRPQQPLPSLQLSPLGRDLKHIHANATKFLAKRPTNLTRNKFSLVSNLVEPNAYSVSLEASLAICEVIFPGWFETLIEAEAFVYWPGFLKSLCPSSNGLGPSELFRDGGSGSFGLEFRRLSTDVAIAQFDGVAFNPFLVPEGWSGLCRSKTFGRCQVL